MLSPNARIRVTPSVGGGPGVGVGVGVGVGGRMTGPGPGCVGPLLPHPASASIAVAPIASQIPRSR